jgi:peptidoglycan/LPS O-acetylase OafA/YrhL
MDNALLGNQLLGRTNNFDFIRFAAALVVIFSHSCRMVPLTAEPLLYFTKGKYDLGYISVSVFFVISGFLITMSFKNSTSISNFFLSRSLRIYPALLFVVLVSVFIIGPLISTERNSDYFSSLLTAKYLLNIFSIVIQFRLPGVFEHNYLPYTVNASLWTLPNEIACYFTVAIAGTLFEKKIFAGILLFLVTFSLFFHKFFYEQDTFYVQLIFFASGSFLYVFKENILLNKYLALLAAFVFILNLYLNTGSDSGISFKLLNTLVKAISLSYLVIYLSFIKTKHLKNFAKYGDYSYGLYIWAWPLQQIISLKFGNLSLLSFFVFSSLATLAVAMISWHLIEKKAIDFKKSLKLKRQFQLQSR